MATVFVRDYERSGPVRLSWTLSLYIARRLVQGTGLVLLTLALIGYLLDAVEQLRRISDDGSGGLVDALLAASLRLPYVVEQVLPFAMLFGALLTFQRLTRTHELVAARAAGVSVWQFLTPAVGFAALVGLLAIGVLNPFAAALYGRYQSLDRGDLESGDSDPVVAPGGIWLKQKDGDRQLVINAREILYEPLELRRVVIYEMQGGTRFAGRIDAARGRLVDGAWRFEDIVRTAPDGTIARKAELVVPTRLSGDRIQESFKPPETISFWELPGYAELLRTVGFPDRRHVLQFQSLLARPLLFCAMLLIGTLFSLRFARSGGAWLLFVGGLVAGFSFYAISDVVLALGLSGRIPAPLAAWTPAVIAVLLGVTMLFYLEDG